MTPRHARVVDVWLTAKLEAQVAKDSFSHRSSHQRIVTRSPNHMCDSSCSIVSSAVPRRSRRSTGCGRCTRRAVSRNRRSPSPRRCTPARTPGRTFRTGKAKSKCSSKAANPSAVMAKSRSASRCSASDCRQNSAIGIVARSAVVAAVDAGGSRRRSAP